MGHALAVDGLCLVPVERLVKAGHAYGARNGCNVRRCSSGDKPLLRLKRRLKNATFSYPTSTAISWVAITPLPVDALPVRSAGFADC